MHRSLPTRPHIFSPTLHLKLKEFPVERYYRDVKLCTIGEGASEIQQILMARYLIKRGYERAVRCRRSRLGR